MGFADSQYVLAVLVVTSLVTFALRLLPFVALKNLSSHPVVCEVSKVMPLGVMVILVAYTVKDVSFTQVGQWLPAAGGIVATIVVHLLIKKTAVSLVFGVFCFAALGFALS